MTLLSARRVTREDHPLIDYLVTRRLKRVGNQPGKLMWKHIDKPTVLDFLYTQDTVWIVDGILIAYAIVEPWYATTTMLQELLVLRLYPTGDFSVVPEFLNSKAREAGARLCGVGTALTRNDAALASIYEKHGFERGAITLVKEP